MKCIKIIIGLSIVVWLSACATLDPQDIPEENALIKPEAIAPELSYDIFQFRIDVDRNYYEKVERNTERTERGSLKSSNKTKTEKSPYSYMGIYYGNGFFLDAHKNLSIDVIKLLKLDELEYFKITKNSNGLFDSYFECIKDGNIFTVITKEPIKKEINAVLEDGIITINDSKEKLTIEEEAITYRSNTMLGNLTQEKIQKEDNLAKLAGRYVYELQTNGKGFNVGKDNHLYVDGNMVYYSKIDEENYLFKMLKTNNGYVFMESADSGFTIKRIENKIIIKLNGKETFYDLVVDKNVK